VSTLRRTDINPKGEPEGASTSGGTLVPFVFATMSSLPFAVGPVLYAADFFYHDERITNFILIGCLFYWPVFLVLAALAVPLIVLSWFFSPGYCRRFLVFYVFLIIGSAIVEYTTITGLHDL
jgi:hypothetical protein